MTECRHNSVPVPNRNARPSNAEFDGNPPRQQPIGELSKNPHPLRANHFGSQRCQMLTKHVRSAKAMEVAGLDVSNAHLGGIAQG